MRGGGASSPGLSAGSIGADIFMNRKSPRITAVELLRALKRDGWFQVRQSGSHIIMRHPEKSGCVVVPNHARVVLKQKTLDENLERAGLTKERLWTLL